MKTQKRINPGWLIYEDALDAPTEIEWIVNALKKMVIYKNVDLDKDVDGIEKFWIKWVQEQSIQSIILGIKYTEEEIKEILHEAITWLKDNWVRK